MLKNLLHKCCEMCEEGKFETCDCYMSCHVYGLYVEAQKKIKTKVVNTDNWQTPLSPKAEML